jgi:hypothetical protein
MFGGRNFVAMGGVSDYKRMDRSGVVSRNRVRILCVAFLLSFAAGTQAAEKHWIAYEAELVVVGTCHQGLTYPWIDGWHVAGVLDVNETLFGPRVTRQIKYQFVCRWNAMCRVWPPPRFSGSLTQKGIWFLRSVDRQTWGPPSNGGTDPGFRTLSQRADFENCIRLYKR